MKELRSLETDQPPTAMLQTLAVVGFSGLNAQKRLLPELARLNGRFHMTGYDLKPPAQNFDGIPCLLVRDDDDLAERLHEQRPEVAIIQTLCDLHPAHIRLALAAGARLVLCEKCVGVRVSHAADELMPVVRAARPQQQAWIIDHYRLLEHVITLRTNAPRWIGEVERMEVTLYEEKGVPPHQERSHAAGMANFIHHVIALAGLFFDLSDLVPVQAAWAKHPDAHVPDTYRAAQFKSRRTGAVVLTGAVGKYMKNPRKDIVVEGRQGRAWIDRQENEMMVLGEGGLSVQARREPDSGYGALVNALASGEMLRCAQNGDAPTTPLMTIEEALCALRLVTSAHDVAQPLPSYPDGQEVVFG